jgi:hypothetical protein
LPGVSICPSEGVRFEPVRQSLVTEVLPHSRGVSRSTEFYERRSTKRIGLLLPTVASLFQADLCGLPSTPAPVPLRETGSSSHELASPSELVTDPNPSDAEASDNLPWSSCPHRDISTRSLLEDGTSKSHLAFRPQRFSRSRRFAPSSTLRVYFTSQPRSGFTFQGLFPAA